MGARSKVRVETAISIIQPQTLYHIQTEGEKNSTRREVAGRGHVWDNNAHHKSVKVARTENSIGIKQNPSGTGKHNHMVRDGKVSSKRTALMQSMTGSLSDLFLV